MKLPRRTFLQLAVSERLSSQAVASMIQDRKPKRAMLSTGREASGQVIAEMVVQPHAQIRARLWQE
jgi:hypothetical protein